MSALPPDVAEVILGSIGAKHMPGALPREATRQLFTFYLRDQITPGADQTTTCQQNQAGLNRLLAGAIALLDVELTARAEREGRTIQDLLHEILLQRVGS